MNTTNQGDGRFDLPTEAEWEHAARAGTTNLFWWGDTITIPPAFENISDPSLLTRHVDLLSRDESSSVDDGHAYTAPAGSFRANPWGLHDMLGNVKEWCRDWHSPTFYRTGPKIDPFNDIGRRTHVVRGGSWLNGPSFSTTHTRWSFSSEGP